MLLNCVLEKTSESLGLWDLASCPEGNQSWTFIGQTDAETEAPIFWPPDTKNWLIWKDPIAGKDWRQEEKGTMEDETVGWHHWCNGHEFEQAPGVCDRQGSLECFSTCSLKESDRTVTELNWYACACVLSRVWVICDPITCSLPGSSVHEIRQTRIQKQVAISYSRESSWPRDQTWVSCISCIGRLIPYHCTTWEVCKCMHLTKFEFY